MFNTMAKWITPQAPVSAIDQAPEDNDAIEIPALKGIDIEDGLAHTQGDKKLYLMLLKKLYSSQKDFSLGFEAALKSADKKSAERCVHTLRGVAGNIGALQIMEYAAELEQACVDEPSGNDIERILKLLTISLMQAMNILFVVSNEESSLDLASQDLDSNQFNKLLKN